jgi:hypothetical protein
MIENAHRFFAQWGSSARGLPALAGKRNREVAASGADIEGAALDPANEPVAVRPLTTIDKAGIPEIGTCEIGTL